MKISAVIITKNEEDNIKDCLDSLGFADEIIVVDAESTDKTVAVAKRLSAKIFVRKWDNFANQKNFGISKAKNKWILSIDADERVSKELRREISFLKFDKDGYLMPVKNYFLGKWLKHGGQYPDYHLRLFNRSKGKFESRVKQVHEGVFLKNGSTAKLKSDIIHYSYKNIAGYFEKFNNYTYLDARGRFENGVKPSFYGIFLRPLFRFIKWYKLKLGFLDGVQGLVFHALSAFYVFVSEVKLLEMNKFKGLKWRT